MRKEIDGLPSPHPLGEQLPGVYLGDDLTMRLTAALDEVLAPVMLTLDCFAGYLDPRLAPPDFVEYLAGWVAFVVDESWGDAQRRELIARAVELHRWRGTSRGLSSHVELLTGGRVEVADSGSCTWSREPGGAVGGHSPAHVTIRVTVADPSTVDNRMRAAIAELVPAHVRTTVEVVADPVEQRG
jgi:phage tail-like protein